MRRLHLLPALALGLAACQGAPAELPAGARYEADPPLVRGLERLTEGPAYVAGQVERLRLVLAEDTDLRVTVAADAGEARLVGDTVHYVLPPEGDAVALTVSALRPDGGATVRTFTLALQPAVAAPDPEPGVAVTLPLVAAGAAGVIDPDMTQSSSCDLAIGSGDVPHVVYRDDKHPALWYATYTGGAWQRELIDGMGFDVGAAVGSNWASLVLAGGTTPHVVYQYANGEVRYATRGAGGWVLERVDGTYGYDTAHLALALDPANGQRPTVLWSHYPSSPPYLRRLVMAYRTGAGAWVEELAPPQSEDWLCAGALAFDAAGTASFSFFDDWDNDLAIGSWSASGGFAAGAVIHPYAEWGDRSALALDSSGDPVVMHRYGLEHRVGATWSHSDVEQGSIGSFDLALHGDTPHVALLHGALELVTPNAKGYWIYTEAIDSPSSGRVSIAVDGSGIPHVCYQGGSAVTFY